MPPFKEISSLNNICTEWVWHWLYHCLNLEAKPQNRIKQREYILSTLNPSIRQQLINHVCKAHMYQVHLSSKCLLIELLGDKSTYCVDITEAGYSFIDEVFVLYRTLTFGLLLNLKKLGIICNIKLRSDRRHLPDLNLIFYRVFNQMHQLRWVTMSGLGDTNILATLGTNCHHLEYLDVSSSPLVTDESIARLLLQDPFALSGRSDEQVARQVLPTTPLCKTLGFVCVCGTSISMTSITILLHYLSKLTSLGGQIDCGSICSVIQLLQPEDGDVKLFQFAELSDTGLTAEYASLLCLACPNITTFTTGMSCMPVLHILHPLQSLNIEDVRGNPWYIYNYLQMRGNTLKELILAGNITCPLDLAWVMELTPNLERLHSSVFIEEGFEVPDWKMLKVASIRVSSSKVLLAMLAHTPDLRDLNIVFSPDPYCETAGCINDDLIIYIALSGGLKQLEKLTITECDISVRGIDCLLMHSPELWYFAQLIFWHNVSQEDIKRLRLEAIQNNWKLTIILRDDWEGKI